MITIELVDKDGLMAMLAKAGVQGVQATKQALNEEAQLMFRESQRLVPVDTGTLRRSGVIQRPVEQGSSISITMGYGGAASAYALRQHEDLSYKHSPGKQAKYLEDPVRDRAKQLPDSIRKRIERKLGL